MEVLELDIVYQKQLSEHFLGNISVFKPLDFCLHRFEFIDIADIPPKRSVVKILDPVLSPPQQSFGDLHPLVAIFLVQLEDPDLLGRRDLLGRDLGVEVVVPPLPAHFARPLHLAELQHPSLIK